jgi:hypothetical protein
LLSLARERLRRTDNREKANVNTFWLRDESLEESDNLDVLARESSSLDSLHSGRA